METKIVPAVYVGTYHKYNCGSIYGKWMTLSDYSDFEEFYDACKELHKDEDDPEFMCQDKEYIPDSRYCESGIEWLKFYWDELADLSDDQLQMVYEYWDEVDGSADAQDIVERYFCEYMDDDDFGAYLADMNGFFRPLCWTDDKRAYEHQLETLERYFDFAKYGAEVKQEMHITEHYIFS